MGFDAALRGDWRLALGIGLRAVVLAGLAFGVLQLLATQRLYVTACVLVLVGALLVVELAGYVRRSDQRFERFIDGVMAGDFEQLGDRADGGGFLRQRQALARAAQVLESGRRQREQEIQSLRTLLDTVSVALLVLAEDGSMTLANAAARRLAGQEAGRLAQLPSIGPAAAAALASLAPGERRVVRLASGQRMLAQCASFSAGGVTRRLLSLQNIAGELDAAELKAWQDVLRVLAHEIMGSLTPVASLAESLKPRVSALSAWAAGLQGQAEAPDVVQDVADIAEAVDAIARRSAGLTGFVSRYRRMAELPPPVLQPVSLADVVRRIEPLLAERLAASGISYQSRIDPPDLRVEADRDLLEQLLVNLLHNALEACAGVPQARIEVSGTCQGETVVVRVSDSGRGMDAATLERIFVPLFTTKPGGSGIGLSLARQIAHAHGGTLEAAPGALGISGSGRGATLTLVLPATPLQQPLT